MCRQQIQSRRHVRKDTACDAFIKALNLKQIQHQIETENPHIITPFHIKYKKELENNRKRQQQQMDNVDNAIDIEMESKQETKDKCTTYVDAREYLIRFEPLKQSESKMNATNLTWQHWFKSNELLFIVKKYIAKKICPQNDTDIKVELYGSQTQQIEDTKNMSALSAILSELFTSQQHNDTVKLQQNALQQFDKQNSAQLKKARDHLFGCLPSYEEDVDNENEIIIPCSTNSVAKPFVLFYFFTTI